MADRPFATSFNQPQGSDEPGLALGDDNVVYLIKPDGSRVEVGAGGPPIVTAGCLRIAFGTSLVFTGPGNLGLPFDHVQFDVGGVADLVNQQLVIPAGKDGLWAFGCRWFFTNSDPTAEVLAEMVVNGNALNIDFQTGATGAQLLFAGDSVDVFAAGDFITMDATVDKATTLTDAGSGDPGRMWAYYLGPVA